MSTLSPLAPTLQYLLQDDFYADPQGPVNSTIWGHPTGAAEYIPSALGPSYPGRELQPRLPDVSNGTLQLPLQTYNKTSNPPETSFQGSGIFTKQSFDDNTAGQGIAFTAVAKLGTEVAGLDGGIYTYFANSSTSHNEVDFESLSDFATAQNNQEQTNVYENAPYNAGDPQLVPDPSLTIYQTYTLEWYPTEVLYFINGQLVSVNTTSVPQGAMQFWLDFWAYDAKPVGTLQPTSNSADNITYDFDVQSASVAAITDAASFVPTPPVLVNALYEQVLGRAADPTGYNYWEPLIANGLALATVESDLAYSTEAAGDISPLYQCILGRNPDPGGLGRG